MNRNVIVRGQRPTVAELDRKREDTIFSLFLLVTGLFLEIGAFSML